MIRVQNFKFPIFQLSIFQSEQFFKTLYEVAPSTTKIFLLKSGIIKNVNKENKESMNKSSSKNVFLRFQLFTLRHILVATYSGVLGILSNINDGYFLRK